MGMSASPIADIRRKLRKLRKSRKSHRARRGGGVLTAEMKLQRAVDWGTHGLFFLLLLLGGGGAPNPLMQALLEAAALAWLLFLLWAHLFHKTLPKEALWPIAFLAALLLLPALQMVPLPYSIWSTLPGREQAVEAVRLAGLGAPWMPISLAPERTVTSALPLIGALAMMVGAYMLEPERRLSLLRVALVVALISAFVGALQFTMPNTPTLYLHKKTYFDLPSGLFANRNFQSDLLLIGILLCAANLRMLGFTEKLKKRTLPMPTPWETICLLGIPFLTLMALATLSRSGAVMLAPTLLAAFVIASPRATWRVIAAGVGLLAAAGASFFLFAQSLREALLSRFEAEASRLDALPDLAEAARLYFPVGSGVGTFDPIFRTVESLSFVHPPYFNHAHNDYAEILIEAGLAGILLVALFLAAYAARMALLMLRKGDRSNYLWMQRTAGIGIGILLVHSLADYPLRTMTLQALFAVFCVLLFSHGAGRPRRTPVEPPR